MSRICIFSCPKTFEDHTGRIQRNAIRSWTLLGEDVDVVLVGDDPGVAEAASGLGVRHCEKVDRNDAGTPIIKDIFRQAQNASSASTFIYANCDIVLFRDVVEAVNIAENRFDSFLTIGRRTDLDVEEDIECSSAAFSNLRQRAREDGNVRLIGIDYFGFPRGEFDAIPRFAVGRIGWDNWMVYHARSRGTPVIDASKYVRAIHQNHDYRHLDGGTTEFRQGKEANQNIDLAGGREQLFSLEDSTHRLTANGTIMPALGVYNLWRRVRTAGVLYPNLAPITWLAKKIEDLSRPLRLPLGISLSEGVRRSDD